MSWSGAVSLIGDPVAHSVSPAMHRAAFAAVGLDLDYVALPMRAEELPRSWAMLSRTFVGLNVTRPLKEAVLPLLDVVQPEAAEAGSVNTVVFRTGLAEGYSTDGEGFFAALRRAGVDRLDRAVVLGTGGAARAVTAALRRAGTKVVVCGRSAQAGRRLVSDLGGVGMEFVPLDRPSVVAAPVETQLLVNATPVGGWAEPEACPLLEGVGLRPDLIVFDLVYRPRRTLLLRRAADVGCCTIPGVEMLVEQGTRSFELWTGVQAPTGAMRSVAYEAQAGPLNGETNDVAPLAVREGP